MKASMAPSSYTVFARKVKGTGWSKRMIRRKFLREVEKDDYNKKEAPRLLENLYALSEKLL